jgi:hypothetical protein
MTMAPETMPTAEDFAMMEDSDVAALSPLARAEYFQWRYEQEKTARQAAEKRASEGRAAPCPISEAQFAAEAPELPLVVFGQRIKTMRRLWLLVRWAGNTDHSRRRSAISVWRPDGCH